MKTISHNSSRIISSEYLTPDKTRRLLGVLGLIPFVGSSMLIALDWNLGSIDPTRIFLSYSAVILSFLSGALWGRCLNANFFAAHPGVLILTNVLALLAWAGLLLQSFISGVVITLAFGFALILFIEKRYQNHLSVKQDKQYTALRAGLTYTVLGTHLLVFFSLA